jgi:hypothetical protein
MMSIYGATICNRVNDYIGIELNSAEHELWIRLNTPTVHDGSAFVKFEAEQVEAIIRSLQAAHAVMQKRALAVVSYPPPINGPPSL